MSSLKKKKKMLWLLPFPVLMVWAARRFVARLQIHFRAGKVGMLPHSDTLWGEKLHFQLVAEATRSRWRVTLLRSPFSHSKIPAEGWDIPHLLQLCPVVLQETGATDPPGSSAEMLKAGSRTAFDAFSQLSKKPAQAFRSPRKAAKSRVWLQAGSFPCLWHCRRCFVVSQNVSNGLLLDFLSYF